MSVFRVALANVRCPATPAESVDLAVEAVEQAGAAGAAVACFPECYVPGYRAVDKQAPAPDAVFLDAAWERIASAAARARVGVVLGTERVTEQGLVATALVIDAAGRRLGFQDKVQIDPSEEPSYTPGVGRRVFTSAGLIFGIAICHEGWRYPETVRWAARRGAQLVFHPHAHVAEPASYRPTTFADPANSFHEKAVMCRAAENTIWFASVNAASDGSGTTSAVARPDGSVLCWQPYGQPGLLVADLDLGLATRRLALRCRSSPL